MPVPARKWYDYVRVCSDCRQQLLKNADSMPGIRSAFSLTKILFVFNLNYNT